jgi:Family of unknown function (DUF6152)
MNGATQLSLTSLFLAVLGSCGPTFAHHSFAVQYDDTKPLTIEGWVTKVEWTNPHVYFYMDVEDEQGRIENWAFEMVAPIVLERRGWNRNTLAIGELVEVDGFLARDGSRLASAAALHIVRTGKRFSGTTRQELPDGAQ